MGMNIRVKRYSDGAAFRQRRRERNVWFADVEAERGEDFLFMARTDFVCGGKLLREGFFSVRIFWGRKGFLPHRQHHSPRSRVRAQREGAVHAAHPAEPSCPPEHELGFSRCLPGEVDV